MSSLNDNPSKVVLFQGDSITDAGRDYENDNFRGYGYATIATAKLSFIHPAKYSFINRGISGNTIKDLQA